LEELVVVLYPHVEAINVEDLEEIVVSWPPPSGAGKQELMMQFVQEGIEHREASAHRKPIKLTFVKAKEGRNCHVAA
jgi:hypothetical protein